MTNIEMLSTIKLLSDISDTSMDTTITYYIEALQRRIKNICGLSEFPPELCDLVIDIAVKKVKDDILDELDSLHIGDTNIKLKNNSKSIIEYLNDNMSELENFTYTEVI
jgi:hypothetical protein